MKIITRQTLANTAPRRFKEQYEQYRGSKDWRSVDHGVVIDQLAALVAPIDPDDVDRIIGNSSWTNVPHCDECGTEYLELVVEMGEEPDYESSTAYICIDCLQEALNLAG